MFVAQGGEPLYQRLRDRLFNAPRRVRPEKCPNTQCGLVWLDRMPIEEDISKAHRIYFTGSANEQENVVCGKNRHRSVPGSKADGFELLKCVNQG